MKKRLFIIGIWVVLMLSMILIVDKSYQAETESATVVSEINVDKPIIPTEAGVFQRADLARIMGREMNIESQTGLNTYYNNRAYPGAPPVIPHPLGSDKGIGENACLQCHENGGYVNKYNAYAPVTPHPQMVNCKQCHIEQKTTGQFTQTTWQRPSAPEISNNALPGSPPIIPHSLQMRENCLSCHAGPSAPKEIRVKHPERSNCLQCHAVNVNRSTTTKEWVR